MWSRPCVAPSADRARGVRLPLRTKDGLATTPAARLRVGLHPPFQVHLEMPGRLVRRIHPLATTLSHVACDGDVEVLARQQQAFQFSQHLACVLPNGST